MASNDITLVNLRDNVRTELQPTYDAIITAGGLPAGITVGEFLSLSMKGARRAANAANAALTPGEQIIGYGLPDNSAVQSDPTTGEDFYFQTYAVQVKVSSTGVGSEVANGTIVNGQ